MQGTSENGLQKGWFCTILFVPFLSYMRHENVWLVSDWAAVIEIAKSKQDVLSRGYTSVFCLRWRCDLFGKLSRRRRAVVATLGDKVRDFVATISTQRIPRDFFLRFFQLSHNLCERGYKCDFHRALATRQFKKKFASPSQAKLCSCSRSFSD